MNQTGLQTNDPSDDILWKQLLQGDPISFERIMANHLQTLFQYGLKFSNDQEFVKDTIQDLFLYVWAHRQSLSDTIAVRPYLMASLRRMMHRASSKNSFFETSVDNTELHFDVEFSVETKYIRRENTLLLGLKLKKNLDALPSRQKEAIYLKFYQGLSRDQISEIMDISPQTVSNLMQIAIKQLRKLWKKEIIASSLLVIISLIFN